MAKQTAMYIFHHVFLPPKLPQSDDFDPENDEALVSFIYHALGSFKNHDSGTRSIEIGHAEQMLQLMLRIHQTLGDTVAINEAELAEALRDLVSSGIPGKSIVLHIRAQNAGVLIGRANDSIHVESFELSPQNNAVFSTPGRLRRCFPATATSVSLERVQQDGFQHTLAAALSKMSSQHAPDTQPKVKKAGQVHQEIRDTTHPKVVTQLLNSYLLAMGTQIQRNKIWKNTREEVLWHQALLPWRRSPTWLLIRVALQLVWGRVSTGFGSSADIYKDFMLFLLAEILGHSIQLQLPSEDLLLMTAKISRRLHKLDGSPASSFLAHVHQTMFRANELLAARWSKIQNDDSPSLNLSRLRSLDFDQDVMLDLPEVDKFVQSIATRANPHAPKDFIPPWTLIRYDKHVLPGAPTKSDLEHLALNLTAFEVWVKDNLEAWLTRRLQDQDQNACSQLRELVEKYHSVACPYYSADPEAMSLMLLTILDLWIACDTMATSIYPMLCDYDVGLPKDILQNLNLPWRHNMERLHRVEDYVDQRSQKSRFRAPNVYSDFGSSNCFPVRYFDQSEQHQRLFNNIEAQGHRDREAKRTELKTKKKQYDDLMSQWASKQCEYHDVWNQKKQRSYVVHSKSCFRHRCLARAEGLSIQVHEWPLPPRMLEAKSVVFELSVPLSFGQWRELTTFVLFDVLKVEQSGGAKPREKYTLDGYKGLSDFFSRTVSQNIYLLSEDKPHTITHYQAKPVGTTTEQQVCLDNALHYKYFNGRQDRFFSSFLSTDRIPKQCTYEMPQNSTQLQKFLFRPASQPNGPSPNTVIASQSDCPNHITLEEYKALCAIPLGYRIQWEAVLLQLFSPSIDFKKMETRLIILQCIYQTGPPNESPLREAHTICDDEVFAKQLLEGLREATSRFEENWQSSISLSAFIAIGSRLLSLTSYKDVQDECLIYLSTARRATFAWVETLKTRCQDNNNNAEKVALQRRALEVALICMETFSVDDLFKERLFSDDEAASIFIQCSIAIQEISQSHQRTMSKPFKHLLSRWQRTCFQSYRILTGKIVIEKGHALDQAICASWSGYQPHDHWRVLSETHDTWLTTHTGTSEDQMPVHFCLVTGELLVNGIPLDHLPSSYIQHPAYATLFGLLSIEIMPTSVPGLQFSSKRQYAEHNVHLGLDQKQGTADLLVHAVRSGNRFDLIPKRCLRERFPHAFVEEYVHWYDHLNDCLELRPTAAPWNHSVSHWKITRSSTSGKWVLGRGDSTLIGLKSKTAQVLFSILNRLEDSPYIHITYHRLKSSLTIDLPRLRLEFSLNSGDTTISSRQFRGMSIDEDQSIGTLIGLRDKLVLRLHRPRHQLLPPERKVLVSEGRVSFSRQGDHVTVAISKDDSTGVQAYSVDKRLGRLVGNGSRQSKLFLAYMHALTSFGLPDPLSRSTGTESALSILRSASITSFDRLSRQNLDTLCLLGRLTPGRGYYPAHKREMQVVAWSPQLSCLAQHGFYHESVQSILRLAERSKFFYPELYVEPPRLDHVTQDLLERDNIRSSTFRISGFGAERHSISQDAVYNGRDCETSSQSADAFSIASSIFMGNASLPRPLLVNVEVHLWNFLQKGPPVSGIGGLFEPDTITYDADYLSEWSSFVGENWIHLHQSLGHNVNKFRLMIWLATLAFCKTSDMAVLQVLTLFHTNRQRMREISPPPAHVFELCRGASFCQSEMQRITSTALVSLDDSPEAHLTQKPGELEHNFERRQGQQFQANKEAARRHVVSALQSQWPCRRPKQPHTNAVLNWRNYIRWLQISPLIVSWFETWDDNRQFKDYIRQIATIIPSEVSTFMLPPSRLTTPTWNLRRQLGYLGDDDIFERPLYFTPKSSEWILKGDHYQHSPPEPDRVESLIQTLEVTAKALYEKGYVDNLQLSCKSLRALAATTRAQESAGTDDENENSVTSFYSTYQDQVVRIYSVMLKTMFGSVVEETRLHAAIPDIFHRPRISPIFFLRRLNKNNLCKTSKEWKQAIIQYGIAVTQLQRAERMLAALNDPIALANEVRNPGHTNWDPHACPDTLLLEVESGILLREIQEEISKSMRNPPHGGNSVMQLNMGEGKSSVIAPAVAAALADGDRLVRIIVAKPQSKQMLQMLDSKLGDLLDRRIFHLPFSRAVKVGTSEANAIRAICRDCVESRGIMLVQPEHILSFQLMGIETAITGKMDVSRLLLETKSFLDHSCRDIVDESDENFSIKFELVYTMGTQQSIEHSPSRWTCIHHVLDIFRKALPEIEREDPKSVEVSRVHNGCFPRTRILRDSAKDILLDRLARHLSESGSTGLPMATQPHETQEAVYRYISQPNPSKAEIDAVESSTVWSASTKDTLLLLRGLIGCQILSFVFCQKRWRVDFGLDPNRRPETRLAVPYRAKDNPTARSEFSHPDVIITLTSLSYYYGGLNDHQLFLSFEHLVLSDQADMEYRVWVGDSNFLPLAFHQLSGINLEDRTQCVQQIFPCLRYAKGVVDYYLAFIVFPKELKEFPHKLSASGWDIGEKTTHPTTGFSGTCDSQTFLPLAVSHIDLPEQQHTNAMVLGYLLQDENSVELMPRRSSVTTSDAEALIDMVIQLKPPARVILDVGAQILELDNLGVARTWLEKMEDHDRNQAVIFCDENDNICVVDRRGRVEAFHTSPFYSQTDVCLVFLDEAHTRGTDLKLPECYRAAVTLGANLTKDRLVQACMRMRQLGKGQSVVFCVPDEIREKMKDRFGFTGVEPTVSTILQWTVSETWIDLQRGIWLWANQGRRHQQHSRIWSQTREKGRTDLTAGEAEGFLEDEAQSLDTRYRPNQTSITEQATSFEPDAITRRLLEFGGTNPESATFREEQERELSPEVEQEREVQKPAQAKPAAHSIHPDVRDFVSSGTIRTGSEGYTAAFRALQDTSAAEHFDVARFPRGLHVTKDFIRTIIPLGKGYISDLFQRPVQWILTSTSRRHIIQDALVVSPFEAQELLPIVKRSRIVALHVYAPRPNLGFRSLDSLDLYVVPQQTKPRVLPRQLVIELNVFSGQMYLGSYEEYLELRQFLGFDVPEKSDGQDSMVSITAPRDVKSLDPGLLQFLRIVMMKIRRNCESIDKTHIGRVLDQRSLLPSDFE